MVRKQTCRASQVLALSVSCAALLVALGPVAGPVTPCALAEEAAETASAQVATARAELTAKVTLAGSTLSANQFTFSAEALDSAPAPEQATVSNAADGSVSFGSISFTAPGDYAYRVTQRAGDLASVDYDDSAFEVVFHVGADSATGALEVSSVEGQAVFSNTVQASSDDAAPAAASVDLSTKVSVEGASLNAGAFVFRITLKDGAPEPEQTMAVNAQDGTVDFGGASFTSPGTYTYEVTQVPGETAGMTYDDSVITLTVTVSQNSAKTALQASVKTSREAGFKNSYSSASAQAGESAGAQTSQHNAVAIITASISRESGIMSAGAFSFDIVDDSGSVVTTGVNDANGTVRFSAIELTQAGTYSYTVQPGEGVQLASSQEKGSFRVEVAVDDAGTGLLATVSYPDGRPSFVVSSTSGQAGSSAGEDSADLVSQVGAAISPTMIAVAVVGGVALIAAVVAIIWLQSRSKEKPAASPSSTAAPGASSARELKPIDHPVPAQDVSLRATQAVVDVPVIDSGVQAAQKPRKEEGAAHKPSTPQAAEDEKA